MSVTLESLRSNHQIADAITGFVPPELTQKMLTIMEGIDRITHINQKRVFDVTVDQVAKEVHYAFRRGAKTRYYYPIQYAKIQMNGSQ